MINVVKIGGNVVDNPEALRSFLQSFAALPGRKVLVHGGGKEATRLSAALGVETKMIEGRRVTDRDTIDIVTMTYAGLINKRIVALLQSMGCNAIGLSGADGNAIPAKRRPAQPVDYGYVGDIDPAAVNADFIDALLQAGCTPVFCAICHDGQGQPLNCNADSVASALAVGLSRKDAVTLTYCFEKPGVMTNLNDPTSVIPHIDASLFQALKADGTVAAGMVPKIHNALQACAAGVSQVRITDSLASTGTVIQ